MIGTLSHAGDFFFQLVNLRLQCIEVFVVASPDVPSVATSAGFRKMLQDVVAGRRQSSSSGMRITRRTFLASHSSRQCTRGFPLGVTGVAVVMKQEEAAPVRISQAFGIINVRSKPTHHLLGTLLLYTTRRGKEVSQRAAIEHGKSSHIACGVA